MMEYFSHKWKEVLTRATTQIDMQYIMLSEGNQT